MTKSHLRACPACARHVRVSEEACPFCRSALSDSFRASAAPQAPGARLTRAALFAFGTGTLSLAPVLAPGCSSSSVPPMVNGVDAAYGGPPIDSGPSPSADSAYGAPPFDGPVPVYGAPVDAGVDAGGNDAAADAPVMAAYGGPPIDSGHD